MPPRAPSSSSSSRRRRRRRRRRPRQRRTTASSPPHTTIPRPSPPPLLLLHLLLLLLLAPPLCQSIRLDVHVPLIPDGCIRYQSLLANRLLREASHSDTGQREEGEVVDLYDLHVPHVTLYLADFDLEDDDDDDDAGDDDVDFVAARPPSSLPSQTYIGTTNDRRRVHPDDDGGTRNPSSTKLNSTKVNAFLDDISNIDLGGIYASHEDDVTNATTMGGCHLALFPPSNTTASSDDDNEYDGDEYDDDDDYERDSHSSPYYVINGDYTMLRLRRSDCLRSISDALLTALKSHVRRPVIVPSWVASMPEPYRSAGIYRCREYGSPNVLDGFVPHVTVGYDPTNASSASTSREADRRGDRATTYGDDGGAKRRRDRMRWRIEAMERWARMYERLGDAPYDGGREGLTCVDDVAGIALGVSGVGGTVLANTNMGYWTLHRDYDAITTIMTGEG